MNRLNIMQDDLLVGSIPRPSASPYGALRTELIGRTGDPMASVRTTDFKTEWFVIDDGWSQELRLIADPMLGSGDLADLQGFIPHQR